MHLDQDMASRLGESLRLLCGIRPVRMIPETRERQLRDEVKSGRYPIHAYQSDPPSQKLAVSCSKCRQPL